MRAKIGAFVSVTLAAMVTVGPVAVADDPGSAAIDCLGNSIYEICVNTGGNVGGYTARTGPDHPKPNRDVLYGGVKESTVNFNSYRSFTSGTTYAPGTFQEATDLTPFAAIERVGPRGIRTTYDVTSPDDLRIEHVVTVNGSTLQDSNVEVATTITNTGSTPVAMGIRYQWDFNILGRDDGPTFRPRQPDQPVLTTEAEFRPPRFMYYEIQDNEFDPSTGPLYTVLASGTGPTNVTPAPTPPTQVSFASRPDAIDTAFDYSIIPGRDVTTWDGGINDSVVLYWWGHDASSAIVLPPGAAVTKRALLFATGPGEPPPFDAVGPRCRQISATNTSRELQLHDAQSGLGNVNIGDPTNTLVTVAPFVPGTTDPVSVTARKIDPNNAARFRLEAVDSAGNKGLCTGLGSISW